ncbi:MAG: cytochrome C peroxidase [Campylobacter sp.]|nr:cytochrome C peroxidase [Campylobacter sp.]
MKFFIIFLSGIFCFGSGLFAPIEVPEFDKEKAELGKKIYFETKFNENKLSCDSCHNIYLNQSGSSQKYNTPTILNSALSTIFSQNRTIRNLNQKIKRSFLNKFELASREDIVVSAVRLNSTYVAEFNALYKSGVTFDNIVDALENFVKTLVTPDSKFDKFLKGEIALNADEEEGFSFFLDLGCVSCHNGVNLGSNNFQKSVNSNAMVKVPTLRNITKTSPYAGNSKNLNGAILNMSLAKIIILLSDFVVVKFIKFLETLNGELP